MNALVPAPSVPVLSVPALSVRDLTVRYGRAGKTLPAVDGVSFDVAPGETLGLVGESGSGKSTIGKAILGLQPPNAGRILLHGTDITRASLRQRRVTAIDLRAVFQDPYSSLNPAQTIGQTLTEPLRVLRVPKDQRRPRILESLAAVGLPADAADRYPRGSPAGSGSGSRSPARWCATLRSSCSTSLSAPWTCPRRPRCSTCSPTCVTPGSSRCCSSPTTSASSGSSRSGWSCSTAAR